MDLHRHPDLLERLAAEYALGTLRGGARRRFEVLARRHPVIGEACRRWQQSMAGLTELQSPVSPPPQLWLRISNLLPAQAAARPAAPVLRPRWWDSLRLWRGAALAGALASLAMVIVGLRTQEQWRHDTAAQLAQMRQQIDAARQPQYVAVLLDAQAQPAMLVTFDPARQDMQLQRLGTYREAADQSLQLWALPTQGAPRSLGVLGREPRIRLSGGTAEWPAVGALAVSLEPLGGVPGERGPTGPVLFKGPLIQRTL